MSYISKLSDWYFARKSLPYWCVFLFDCFIVFLSAMAVCIGNNDYLVQSISNMPGLISSVGIFVVCYAVGFRIFRTYTGVIRYSSFIDLQRISAAMLVGLLLTVLCRYFMLQSETTFFVIPRLRDVVLWSVVALLLMWSERVFVKYFYDTVYSQQAADRAFIFDLKEGGVSIAKSLHNQFPPKYKVAGFVTTSSDMFNRIMMGVKIYPLDTELVKVMLAKNVKALFISPKMGDSLREHSELMTSIVEAGIKIFLVPEEQEWDGKSDISMLSMREIQIEDLLNREKIEVDMDAIGRLLTSKRILITGAAGSIGSEIVRQVANYAPDELVLIDQAETPLHDIRLMMARDFPHITAHTIVADISHKNRMSDIFRQHRPEYVFHAAAYKHVPMMENNPAESIQNNVEGTRIVADLSVECGVKKFVMVSTDKAVNPTNVMGCSKRICEIYVQALDKAIKEGKVQGVTQFVTTRFGNVLGSNGSVIPLFREQIKHGGPVTVTHPDIIRYFMLIPEACKLVLEAGTMSNGGEIFVFDMGEPVKIVDLARRMIRLSGAHVDIKFTGLRDGEKLYEEVLNEKETTLPTVHPKIMVAKVREYDYFSIQPKFDELLQCAMNQGDMEIVRRMKLLVPEFRSQHSVYEKIDRELEKERDLAVESN